MNERWQQELKKLGQLDPPDGLWQRIKEGPSWEWQPHPNPFPRVGAAAVALVVAAAGLTFVWQTFVSRGAQQSPAAPTPLGVVENGGIAFRSGTEVYVVEPDGTGLRSFGDFAQTEGVVLNPWEWSPDGTKIALVGTAYAPLLEGGANYDIYVMNADGTSLVNLTGGPTDIESGASELNPRWSPDGQSIAFDGDDGLYVIDADGSNLRRMADGQQGAWSPDGQTLAFQGRNAAIQIIASDGTREMQLTQGLDLAELPTWSPDGTKLAFLGVLGDEKEIYVVNADGSGLTRITDAPTNDVGSPKWSPDGKRLVFQAAADGNWDIHVVNADGTNQTNITNQPGDENSPAWSPDGTKIAFVAGEAVSLDVRNVQTFDVYVVNPDGTGLTRLTTDAAPDNHLAWRPIFP